MNKMSRTIKFRGLGLEDNKWYYGSLITTPTGAYIHPEGCEYSFDVGSIEVLPESVGQFTGLTVFVSKEIYEGDILKCKAKKPGFEGNEYNNEVDFFAGGTMCGFRIKNGSFHKPLTKNWIYNTEAEIIGNIYENPELIK